jgi:hypothetical protein
MTKLFVRLVDEPALVDGLENTGVDELTHVFVFGSGKFSVQLFKGKAHRDFIGVG